LINPVKTGSGNAIYVINEIMGNGRFMKKKLSAQAVVPDHMQPE